MSEVKRKPCFNVLNTDEVEDDLDQGECEASPLWTGVGQTCIILSEGGDWEHCWDGAKSEEYEAWHEFYELSKICPGCGGTGRVKR